MNTIEISNPHFEFTQRGMGVITRAALSDGHPTRRTPAHRPHRTICEGQRARARAKRKAIPGRARTNVPGLARGNQETGAHAGHVLQGDVIMPVSDPKLQATYAILENPFPWRSALWRERNEEIQRFARLATWAELDLTESQHQLYSNGVNRMEWRNTERSITCCGMGREMWYNMSNERG